MENTETSLQEMLKKDMEGYVLITCSKPNEKGEMQVEMTHDGEEGLIAYLLESAQMIVENRATTAKDA